MASHDRKKWMGLIRDQGSCGSCTGFGTIKTWEGCIRIIENNPDSLIDLSERDFFFCAGGTCSSGNDMNTVLNFARDTGTCIEECCPYDGIDHSCGEGRCENWWVNGKKLKSWKEITNVDEMKSILKIMPLVGTMMVHQSFVNYKSGVYHSLGLADPILGGHCISIIDYDDELGAWLIANSWGIDWGESGYAWIKYGDSEIDFSMYQIIPNGEIPPQPNPSPSPCKIGNGLVKIGNFFAWLLHRKGRFFYLNRKV
jgi:C1A family cysteine protease